MEPKTKSLVILLTVLCVVAVITSATFGFLYFKEKSDFKQYKSSSTKEVRDNVEGDSTPEPSDEDDVAKPETVTKEFSCDNWAYASTTEEVPHMYIVYNNVEGVTFSNENKECKDIVMEYKGAKLYLTYSFGEAYPTAFAKGTEVVNLKTGVNNEGDTFTLGRQKYVQKEEANSPFPAGYWLNYVTSLSEEMCTADSEIFDTQGFPCHLNGNPFVTPAGSFSVYFPLTKSSEDILDLVLFFDDVAKNSYYKTL